MTGDEITQDWLDTFAEAKANGEDLAASPSWRLALHSLPMGVNGADPRVRDAVEEIRRAAEKR